MNKTNNPATAVLLIAIVIISVAAPINAQTNTFPGSGYAGVGTTSPASIFHINGNDWNGLTLTNSYNSYKLGTLKFDPVGTYATNKSFLVLSDETPSTDGSNGGILFRTNYGPTTAYTTPFMVIRENGYVGIGTVTPNFRLDVTGGIGMSGNVFKSAPGGALYFSNYSSSALTRIDVQGIDIGGSAGSITGYGVVESGATYGIKLNVDGNTKLAIDGATGRVGIGTMSPNNALSVNGTIGAKEVIVASSGADYVFDEKYRLRPLSEVDDYIRSNHHLPEIPSAATMADGGMAVGEIQTRLLAKIEELTLHMINSQKENDELRARVRKLEEHSDRRQLRYRDDQPRPAAEGQR